MRPVSLESEGPAPASFLNPLLPGPLPTSEMSLLHSLGPVQSWLGQELEKCGIDAMIYTRYVLSLLLHDSYDYDLQDQENDIFLGWEKGAGKKWGKGKKKAGTDLSVEEMKKQAAVQCLRSASDENSGIESLVEELCSKLKDIQNKQKEEKQANRKCDGSQSPDLAESPSSKDQVEMYYEAFPPLSEKPVCLQEIMTVWNTAKACTYSSSSSSAAPQTSTDTSSPKDCNSEGEATKDKMAEACGTVGEKTQQRRSKKEKENRFYNCTADERSVPSKRQTRHRSEGKFRPRSWSSGSSEGGSSSGGNQGESKTSAKSVRIRHKSQEVSRSKRGRSGQVKLALKAIDKEERRNIGGSCGSTGGPTKQTQLHRKGKRPLKEIRKDAGCGEARESGYEVRNRKEYMEEPLWYTEPITEYFVPLSRRSKLETKYRNRLDSPDGSSATADVENLAERMQGICIANSDFQRAYLAAGTFIDGHYVEMPGEVDEVAELNGTSCCLPPEDGRNLDDEHLSEITHFYEVDIYQSILDPSASDSVKESRILSMIRQKSKEQRNSEAECCLVLDGLELQGESAIRADSQRSLGADGFFMQDLENIAQVWECYSSSSSEDIDGESFAGDSPVRLSPALDNTLFNATRLPINPEECLSEAHEAAGLNSSCFSLFEVQYDSPTLPFPCDSLTVCHDNTDSSSCVDPVGNKQSRLLIWTKNSAFDETEHCSNLSTRTCSPWSHSEETRSDNEQINLHSEESVQFGKDEITCIFPPISTRYLENELLDFLQEDTSHQHDDRSVGTASSQTSKKKSKLESICGIPLEQEEDSKLYSTGIFTDNTSQQSDNYSSGISKDIWTAIGDRDSVITLGGELPDEGMFPDETSNYPCCCLDVEGKTGPVQGPQKKAIQRLEYHLWEGQKEEQSLAKKELCKVDGGDYMTPSMPWDINPEKDNTFILGGVYGELKTFSSDWDSGWAVVPPGDTRGSLLQCAAASDVVTIAGTDVFMNTGSCFAPGHKPLWRPLVSFGQCDQAMKGGGEGLNKGFSFIFHEDLLGTCSGFHGDEPGLDYPFSSFDLNNPFSQVLHVECSFEPEDMASFSPGFKPKSILCSDSESETFHPRMYGINRTQYRAIRISPRTHFRPISASELSPGGGSESDVESEKEEMSLPVIAQADVFDDPQADLKPLEEDAECEGPYYGKSELESGKFLPRLKKSGMEKSAQTSLDSQEGSSVLLPIAEQEVCFDCEMEASLVSGGSEDSSGRIETIEMCREKEARRYSAVGHNPQNGKTCDCVGGIQEFPVLNLSVQDTTVSQPEDCWWQSTICSPLFPGSQCAGSSNINRTALLNPEVSEVGCGASWMDRVDRNLQRRLPTCSTGIMAHTADGNRDSLPVRAGNEGVPNAVLMENGGISTHNSSLKTCPVPSQSMPCSLSLPTYRPAPHFSGPFEEDRDSLASQDSGIPTLEINNPEHIHARSCPGDAPATLPLDHSDLSDSVLRKSSTFPRTNYDASRHFSPGSHSALNRSDDISVCSVSSLSTELSATLSISNEDILDFVVTSDSSAIVTLETDDTHFSDITLSSPTEHGDLWSPQGNSLATSSLHDDEGRNKRLGPLASFFTRSLFAKKVKESRPVEVKEPGWKLFGKVPPRDGTVKDPRIVQKEYETRSGRPGNLASPRRSLRKALDFEPLSTTALILEDRPANLPAKPADEALKHRQQYEEMVAQAKKREIKEAQKRRKQLEDRCKLEDSIGNAAHTWNHEILPNWETMCTSRRVREMWWQGVPPSVRGKVWSMAIGNELNITHELYSICLARAREKWNATPTSSSDTDGEDAGLSLADKEASLELIKLDISRTFPSLCIFQKGGPYHDMLHSILGAYTCYRPDVGYVQGMSFIAAVLILNLDTADAFIAFTNLLNKPCQMAFFRVDHSLMLTYFAAFEVFFEENLPKLFAHFKSNNLSPDIYLIDWIFTLYSKSLPLDLACRVWDVFCRDGDEFLFRTALGILKLYEDILTKMDFIHNAQFLTKLPEDISSEELFTAISTIQMHSKNKKWAQVLQNLQKEQERSSPVLKH
ncbi:hypothetical protein GJAV_G00162400 [Gymnothorax javanicus]|nr:hypothetical protein GJAV_G00162400 [Gymnothorax javanicus]